MSFLKASNTPVTAPSPTPSTASQGSAKRKRPADSTPRPSAMAVSASADPLKATDMMTQVTLAVNYLRDKDAPKTLDDLINYLSCQSMDEQTKKGFNNILIRHSQTKYDKNGAGGKGTFMYRSKYDIRSADELRAYLQQQDHAVGLAVKELADGWPNARQEIDSLRAKNELLVHYIRKKDIPEPKVVWQDDPTLYSTIDQEFKDAWLGASIPADPNDIRNALVNAGIKPSSDAPKPRKEAAKKERKKTARSGGKMTNVHLKGMLRDYSHKRK